MGLLEPHSNRDLLDLRRLVGKELGPLLPGADKSIRSIEARKDLIAEGDRPNSVRIVLEGWAARYKQLPNGRRQILAIMLPGDMCAANAFVHQRMDYSLGSLTAVSYAEIERAEFEESLTRSNELLRALWRNEMLSASIQREWTANIGQRQAAERIAHLFCELEVRLNSVGLVDGDEFEFPLTQADLAEATGLTPVHVNRMVQVLRQSGLIELRSKRVRILDRKGLQTLAMFDRGYLYLEEKR